MSIIDAAFECLIEKRIDDALTRYHAKLIEQLDRSDKMIREHGPARFVGRYCAPQLYSDKKR